MHCFEMRLPDPTMDKAELFGEAIDGYGFDIEKLGTGLSAGEWLPVATLVYETEEASKIAEGLMRQAMKDIVHAERGIV